MKLMWEFLGHRPGLAASRRHWVNAVGSGAFDAMARLLMHEGRAAVYPHPVDGRSLKVVSLAQGKICAICQTTGTTVVEDIPEEDVRLYRLNLVRVRRELVECLGLVADPESLGDPTRAVSLGVLNAAPGRPVPVYLLFAPTQQSATHEIARVVLSNRTGFLLLVPVQPQMDRLLREKVTDACGMLVPLSEIVHTGHTGLAVLPGWQAIKESYCQQFIPDRGAASEPAYQFAKRGMWVLRYNGKATYLEGGLRGAAFIQYLIRLQGQEIAVVRMLMDIAGAEAPRVDVQAEGLSGAAADAGELADKKTIAACKREYQSIAAELEEARENKDTGRIASLQEKMGKLAAYLSSVLGIGGRQRKGADSVATIRKRIARVIDTAIDKIRESDPDLATHLRNSIVKHSSMSYKPDREIEWSF